MLARPLVGIMHQNTDNAFFKGMNTGGCLGKETNGHQTLSKNKDKNKYYPS